MSTPSSRSLPDAPLSPSETGEYTHAQILTILVGLMMGMFLGALDQTIVSTSIRTIADDLNGLSVQAWVTTAYLITSTVATPFYGKLGDLRPQEAVHVRDLGLHRRVGPVLVRHLDVHARGLPRRAGD